MEIIWSDRKRHMGMPLSFTKYSLSEDRLFCQTGCFTIREEEILLYRISDISLKRSFIQRIFGVGTICVQSSDKTCPHLDIINIRDPRAVKEVIFQCVEEAKNKRRMRATEILDDDDGEFFDDDHDHAVDSGCDAE